jgi:hypothetical protein
LTSGSPIFRVVSSLVVMIVSGCASITHRRYSLCSAWTANRLTGRLHIP